MSAARVPSEATPRSVLVTGASGFLGQELVRCLSRRGIGVVGTVRNASKAPLVERAGGTACVADVLDLRAVQQAARGCDAFVHLASAANEEGVSDERAEHVRVAGVRNLASAAASVGGRRLVVGSGYWVYRDSSRPIDERSPTEPKGEAGANLATEQAAVEEGRRHGLEVCVVRPAMVYGDGAWFRSTVDALRAGTYRTIEDGRNPWSFVGRPDTAAAFLAVLERGEAGSVYNVADGAPAAWGEFVRFVADRLGCEPPRSITATEADALYGPVVAAHLRSRRALFAAKLRGLGWAPTVADYRVGVPPVLSEMSGAP